MRRTSTTFKFVPLTHKIIYNICVNQMMNSYILSFMAVSEWKANKRLSL